MKRTRVVTTSLASLAAVPHDDRGQHLVDDPRQQRQHAARIRVARGLAENPAVDYDDRIGRQDPGVRRCRSRSAAASALSRATRSA